MTKKQFIQIYADAVAKGRKMNFPEMRLSEIAASRMGDERNGAKAWRRNRTIYAGRDAAEVKKEFEAATTTKKTPTKEDQLGKADTSTEAGQTAGETSNRMDTHQG